MKFGLILLCAAAFGACNPDQICVQAADSGWSPSTLWSASPTSYQVRYGNNFAYSAQVPKGLYTVTFYFVEPNVTGVGQRWFNVKVNDCIVFQNFDIWGIVRDVNKVLARSVVINVTDGIVYINFDAVPPPGRLTRPAVVSAIRISPVGISE